MEIQEQGLTTPTRETPDGMQHQSADPFDTLLSLEDQYYQEGYDLGVADGSKAGRIEGRLFGLEKGFEKYLQMGKLNGKAAVWRNRLPRETANDEKDATNAKVPPLRSSDRLRKHIDRLTELTEPESLESKNTEDAVNEFDERLAGAKAKATLISRITGESGNETRPASSSAGAGAVGEGSEIEIGRSGKPKASGEMEDFAGLPKSARKAG